MSSMNYGQRQAQGFQVADYERVVSDDSRTHQFPEDDLSPAKGILLAALMSIGVYLAVVCIFSLQ